MPRLLRLADPAADATPKCAWFNLTLNLLSYEERSRTFVVKRATGDLCQDDQSSH
jgi:hypothetical protein